MSSKSSATIEVEHDDFYFKPTFIKAKAGEKITFKVENEGDSTTRSRPTTCRSTSSSHPGKSAKFTVTVPSDGAVFQFHCDFHEAMGMVGRGLHQGRRERDRDPGRDQQLVGLRELRLLSSGY